MKRKILVITESKAIRFLLQTVLHDQFTTITAAEAADAMYWIAQTELPAAIVMDPNLPDTEPWELVEHLKTSGLYKHIPLIVISEQPEVELASLSANYNVDAYFHKPFNPIDLKKKLEVLVNTPAVKSDKMLKAV
jgi:two-component system, chemotaxis family, chemotaxis protein CheY